MEQKKKLLTIVLLGFVVLALAPLMSAATMTPVLVAPLNYTNHTGSITVNCTTSFAASNMTVYINSSAGTMTSLGAITNLSAASTSWEGDVTITSSNDGINQNLSCYADNGTDQAYTAEAGLAGVKLMLDSTDPVCNVSVQHNVFAYKGNQRIDYYSSDAIERLSTSLTIDGPGSQTTVTATGANGPIEFRSNDTKYTGSWALALTVTDRAGNTCTDTASFKTYLPDGDEEVQAPTDSKTKGIVIIVFIALVVYFGFIKKK